MIEKIRTGLAAESQKHFMEEMRALGCSDKQILDDLESFMKKGGKHGNNTRSQKS